MDIGYTGHGSFQFQCYRMFSLPLELKALSMRQYKYGLKINIFESYSETAHLFCLRV